MEDIHNQYKDIIERAVLAGIIAEENKHIYISAIREDDDSELSEIESRLNKGKDEKSYSRYKSENKCINKMTVTDSDKHTGGNKQTKITFYNDDNKSTMSGSSIENYSILNIKDSNYNSDVTDGFPSHASTIRQQNEISESAQDMKSTSIFSKVFKKPMKDQIIDFNVPIYIALKQKKYEMKPDTFNFSNRTQCEISKTCNSERDNLKASEQLRNIRKWSIPKSKISVPKEQHNSSKNIKKFADTCTLTDNIDESLHVHTEHECHGESIENKALAFSAETEIPEHQKENLVLISNYLATESDKATRDCDYKTYTINTRRRLKVRDNLKNTQQVHKTKENYLVNSKVFHDGKKSKTKKQLYKPMGSMFKPSNRDTCKRCRCYCSCQSGYTEGLNDTKTAESNNEDMTSFRCISMENNTCGKDHGRFLNVNIVCQFYDNNDDDDVMKKRIIQDSQTMNGDSKAPVKETEATEENISENEKAKKKNKIQRLSSFLGNMKIKKKPNQLE